MLYTVYKITNQINGKVYIGKHQTKRLDDDYFGSGKHLKHSVEKYGRENFIKEILHVFDNESDMNAKEAELVTYDFCKRDDTYNICEGGKGGWGYINSLPDRHVGFNFDIVAHNKKLMQNDEYRQKRNIQSALIMKNAHKEGKIKYNSFLGKTHSDEWKKNHSEFMKSQTAEKNSQFGSRWITNGLENRKIKVDIVPEGWYYGRIKT